MHFVYAISSLPRKYIYVGMTDHIIRRFHQHNNGYEKTTKPYRPFQLIYSAEFPSRQLARDHEKYLKTTTGKRFLKNILIEFSKFN